MADNAKTYSELETAESVGTDSLIAVANTGDTTLKAATVEQVATPVAEVLSTGALAELEYATSQGKNAIATALTNKGVSTTASETLIEMADKVNNLVTSTDWGKIKGTVATSESTSNTLTGDFEGCFRNIYTGDVIYISGQTVKYIPYGQYTSYTDLVAAATHTLDISTEDGSPLFPQIGRYCVSADFTKLAVSVDDNGHIRVYNISADSGFSLLHEFTIDTASSAASMGCAITNDGDMFFYIGGDGFLYAYAIEQAKNTAYTDISMSYSALYIKNSRIYYMVSGSGSSAYSYAGIIAYTVAEDGTVTFTTVTERTKVYYGRGMLAGSIIWLDDATSDVAPVAISQLSSTTYSASAYHLAYAQTSTDASPYMIDYNNLTEMSKITIDIYLKGTTSASCITLSTTGCFVDATSDASYYIVKHPLWPVSLKVNKTNAVGDTSWEKDGYAVLYLGRTDTYSGKVLYSCLENGTLLYGGTQFTAMPASFNSSASIYSVHCTTDPEEYTFAYRFNNNGVITYFDPYITAEDITSGKYKTATTITPAVADNSDN